MATGKSGNVTISGTNGVTVRVNWSETYDIATNKSTVSITSIQVTSSWYYGAPYYLNGTVSINGTTVITMSSTLGSHPVTVPALNSYGTVSGNMGSLSGITHNNDGSKSISIAMDINGYTIDGKYGSGWKVSGSKSVSLTTIPRVSEPTVSASTVQMGYSVTIYTNAKSASFTHTLTYSFGGATGSIASGVGSVYVWTVPDLAAKISGKTSGKCTITCKTYSGSTLIGSSTVSLTLTVPDKSIPTVSASSVQMGNSVTIYANRNSTAFTHTITYSVGTATGEIGKAAASIDWIPPKSLAAYTGGKTSALCTITCATYNGTALVGTEITYVTLTVSNATVPVLSAAMVEMGNEITISMPKEVETYTHDLLYTLAGITETLAEDISGDFTWEVPLALAARIPRYTEEVITITCVTRFQNSDALVGRETVSFIAIVPNNETTQPKATMTVECISDLPSKFDGIYVAGKTKAKVTYEASSDYSTIQSYSTTILSTTGSTNPYTSALLTAEGNTDITGVVTDARGYSTTKTASVTVVPYSRPRILPGEGQNKIICTRCNSNGQVDAGGAYLLIEVGRKYSKVETEGEQKNFCKLSYRHKTDAADESGYSDPIELLSESASSDYVSVVLRNIVPMNTIAYTIQIIAEDDVGDSDVVTVTIPTVFVTFHSPEGGHGFTLGGYHDPSKIDVFDCLFDAEFQGDVSGRALGLGALPEVPEGADANDYKEFGAFSVRSNEIASTLVNFPEEKEGTLRVWSANGEDLGTNDTDVIQEYIPFDNICFYRRHMHLSGEAWEYGEWKVMGGCDAITSQGQTDSWYWRKYANGTAVCWRRVSQAVDITNQKGNMYYGVCQNVTFPFTFVEVPVCHISVECLNILMIGSYGKSSKTAPAQICVLKPETANPEESLDVVYHAIGRWK